MREFEAADDVETDDGDILPEEEDMWADAWRELERDRESDDRWDDPDGDDPDYPPLSEEDVLAVAAAAGACYIGIEARGLPPSLGLTGTMPRG